MSPDLLVIKDVCFSLQNKQILSHVSFQLDSGKTLALIGHNGAGKTTLFHLVLGLKFRTEGLITISGRDAAHPSARQGIGFVPERPYLNLDLTFRKTLHYLGALSGMSKSKINSRILEVAKEVDLDQVMDRPLKTYSKGMLQRTLIAQAILHDPSLLILDEPMSGLDPEARDFLKNKIRDWKRAGKSILFSSHVMEDVRDLADQVVALEAGQITYSGSVEDWGKA